MSTCILVVEDDDSLRTGLIDNLEYEGYQVLCADNGDDGLRIAMEDQPDLLLLDLALPKKDGLGLCRQLRENGQIIPVIMLTAKSEEADKIIGLEVGADDYVTKPFSIRELLARIRSQLRRSRMKNVVNDGCMMGDAMVSFTHHSLVKAGVTTQLTISETEILKLLAKRRGRVVSREDFINTIDEGMRFTNTRALDNCIVKLRRKIEPNPRRPAWILTVHGLGYRFVEKL